MPVGWRAQMLEAADAWITKAYDDRRRWHETNLTLALNDLDDPDDIEQALADAAAFHDANLQVWRAYAQTALTRALAARPELGLA